MINEHLPTPGCGQLVGLQVRVLLGRGDPGVAEQVTHAPERTKTTYRGARDTLFPYASSDTPGTLGRDPGL